MKKKIVLSILLLSFFFRVFELSSAPPSMYWEEAALGYDAYSILKTGKDHHGHPLPIVAFESFGDYKPALYFYTIIPFILLFGLSVWSVRLPSVLAGVVIVYFSGKIAGLFFSTKNNKTIHQKWWQIVLEPEVLTMFVTSVSPWALQFSRGGWEVNLATALLTAGVYLGLLAALSVTSETKQNKKILYYFLTVLFLVLSTYTYHATRVIAPLLGLVLVFPLLRKPRTNWKYFLTLGVFGFILMLPLLVFIRDPSVSHRLQETSTFSTGKEVLESNFYIQRFGSNFLTKLVFHRYWFYLRTVVFNAFSHLRLDFLFLSGDKIARHSIQYFGLFFPTDFFLLVIGLIALLKSWNSKYHLLWLWFVIGLIPASLAQPVPHALRTLPILPVYMIVLGLGLSELIHFVLSLKFSKANIVVLFSIFFIQFLMYWNFYLFAYPKLYASEWQYGYEQMVRAVSGSEKENEKVYITREYGRPAMYYWFFTQTDPKDVQAANATASKDQGEFLTYQNVSFPNNLSGNEKGLIASTPKQRSLFTNATTIQTITDLRGRPVWVVYRSE